MTSLRQTGPGGRGRLELELLWASTSGTRTELALGFLLDLDTLAGLVLLHPMHETWSYAWVSCPHQAREETREQMQVLNEHVVALCASECLKAFFFVA